MKEVMIALGMALILSIIFFALVMFLPHGSGQSSEDDDGLNPATMLLLNQVNQNTINSSIMFH